LTKDEILASVETLRGAGKTTLESSYSLVTLHEPPKAEVLRWSPGEVFRRESFVVVYERAKNQTFEAVVDLRARAVLSWKPMPGVQPSFLLEDAEILNRAIRGDPRFADAMKKRGITDLGKVEIGDWPGGYYGDAKTEGIRFRRAELVDPPHQPQVLFAFVRLRVVDVSRPSNSHCRRTLIVS
jgi:primary-amine oxidase